MRALDPDRLSPATVRWGNLELVRRMLPGTFAVPLLALVVTVWTPLWIDNPLVCITLLVSQGLIALARVGVQHRYRVLYDASPPRARALFAAVMCSSAAVWGVFAAFAIAEYGTSWATMLIMLCTAGILAGGTTSLCLRRGLHRVWILLLTLPIAAVSMTMTDGRGMMFAGVTLLFAVFLMREAKYLHRSFWRSLEKSSLIRDQNERKRRFVASISHEIRTPMTCILGLLELVRDDPEHASNRSRLRTIERSSRELLRLVDELLDVPKLDACEVDIVVKPYDLHAMVEEVTRMVDPAAGQKSLPVGIVHDERVPARIVGDRGRVRQVLLNLVHNAVRYTESGHVTVTVARGEDAEDGRSLQLRVEDTGIGMTTAQIEESLVGPVQAVDASGRLGLRNSHYLLLKMGGSVSIESEVGVGTAVCVTLPLVPAAALPDPVQPTHEGEPARRSVGAGHASPGHVILAGGDDRIVRRMQAALELGGHHVSWVDGPDQVHRILHAHPLRTDAVVFLGTIDPLDAAAHADTLRRELERQIDHVALLGTAPDSAGTAGPNVTPGLDGCVPDKPGIGDPVVILNQAMQRRRGMSGNRPGVLVTRTLV